MKSFTDYLDAMQAEGGAQPIKMMHEVSIKGVMESDVKKRLATGLCAHKKSAKDT